MVAKSGSHFSKAKCALLVVTLGALLCLFFSVHTALSADKASDTGLLQNGSTTWYLAEGSTGSTSENGFYTTVFIQNPGTSPTDVKVTYQTPGGEVAGPNLTVEPQSTTNVNVSSTPKVKNEWSVSTMITSEKPVVAGRSMRWWVTNPEPWEEVITNCEHYSIGVTKPEKKWYLAEGSTGHTPPGGIPQGYFETWVLVQNPGEKPADVQLYYQTPNGEVPGQHAILRPHSRRSWNVGEVLENTWSVSTRVDSSQPVIAERSMYWNTPDTPRQCAHDSIGVTDPSTNWYLAEGSTGADSMGFFDTWVLVQNPSKTKRAQAQLEFQTSSGPMDGPSIDLGPGTRQTVWVNDWVDDDFNVSTTVKSNRPVVAERSMYWNSWENGSNINFRQSAHDSIGATSPEEVWYLPGGPTSTSEICAYESWVTVQNPTDSVATIKITYTTNEGPEAGPTDTLLPKARKSYRINDVTSYHSACTGAIIESDVGVVAENSIYGTTSVTSPTGFRNTAMNSIGFPLKRKD